MLEKTACFTGHRHLHPVSIPQITKNLESVISNLVSQGVIFFGCGGAVGFDMLAGYTVLKMKSHFPQIKLIMVLPCKNQSEKWNQADKDKYKKLLLQADKCVWVQEQYDNQCMFRRNRKLVDHSGVCIAYLNRKNGGSYYTVNYAASKNRQIINLALI